MVVCKSDQDIEYWLNFKYSLSEMCFENVN
jgi:hypothetical protein